MQSQPHNNNPGLTRWVVPTNSRRRECSSDRIPMRDPSHKPDLQAQIYNRGAKNDLDSKSPSNSTTRANVRQDDFVILKPDGDVEKEKVLDMSVCKTVCFIVEENLKELNEHQKLINQARSKWRDSLVDAENNSFITYGEFARLKVRDEQTRAIMSIKHLNNYLEELNNLTRLTAYGTHNSTIESMHNRLSDLRMNVIQSLNDFVINNTDIDIPIIDPENPNSGDYDLCMDGCATRNLGDSSFDEGAPSFKDNLEASNKKPLRPANQQAVKSGSSQPVQQQLISSSEVDLDEHKRNIQKLEKDTVEMRELFSDFHNLVKIQGQQADSIEQNIMQVAENTSQAENTSRADNHIKKSDCGFAFVIPITGCIAGALVAGPLGVIVGTKVGSITGVCAIGVLSFLSSYSLHRCMSAPKRKIR